MPNRIIRDTARTSPTLHALTDGAERCFWRLITTADDYGRFLAEPAVVLSACFPLRVGTLPVKRVVGWLEEMGAVRLVRFYRLADRVFGEFVTAAKHFDRRARTSRYPDPASADICSHVLADVCACEQMTRSTEGFESSSTEDRGTRNGNTSPAPQEVAGARKWEEIPWPSPEALAHLYNTGTPDNVPAVRSLSPERRKKANKMLRLFPDREWWEETFKRYHRSKFLSGRVTPAPGHEGFQPDFDWLLANGKNGTENAVRVHDGNYL